MAKEVELNQEAGFMLNYLSRLIYLVEDAYPGVLESVRVVKPLRDRVIWNFVAGSSDTRSTP